MHRKAANCFSHAYTNQQVTSRSSPQPDMAHPLHQVAVLKRVINDAPDNHPQALEAQPLAAASFCTLAGFDPGALRGLVADWPLVEAALGVRKSLNV